MTASGASSVAISVRGVPNARRDFLLSLSALIAVAGLPACADPVRYAPAPIERFMALSSLLTGYDDLSSDHGRIYLALLLTDPKKASALVDLYAKAGYRSDSWPRSLRDLEARGVFEDEHLRELADTITRWWYTGVAEGPDGPMVVTYTESLAWRSLTYTNAPSTCGGAMGFWADPPAGRQDLQGEREHG